MFHKHPKRKDHQRRVNLSRFSFIFLIVIFFSFFFKTIEKSRPPLPPKVMPGQPGPTPPVAPPRRKQRGLMTPLMQRKDQVRYCTIF